MLIFRQFFFGIAVSILIAVTARYMLKKFLFGTDGFDTIFVIGIAILAYAAAGFLGGNGYLSTYLVGIILGNSDINNKKTLVPFLTG